MPEILPGKSWWRFLIYCNESCHDFHASIICVYLIWPLEWKSCKVLNTWQVGAGNVNLNYWILLHTCKNTFVWYLACVQILLRGWKINIQQIETESVVTWQSLLLAVQARELSKTYSKFSRWISVAASSLFVPSQTSEQEGTTSLTKGWHIN
jgi:hypothetical protein